MTDEVLNAVLAEVAAEQEADTTPEGSEAEDTAQEATEEAPKEADDAKTEESGDAEDDGEQFSKKAINALSRRDKKIGKLRAEKEALQAQLESLQKAQQQKQAEAAYDASAPNEDDFNSYEEYLEAKVLHKLQKANLGQQQQQNNQPTPEQIADYQRRVERANQIEAMEKELVKTIPDYYQIQEENQDIIDAASPELINLFLELENPPLAFATLAKQGKLDSLLEMPIHKAAIEIGKAMATGLPQPKKISSAPNPIKSANGSGTGIKNIENMSYEELKDYLNLK